MTALQVQAAPGRTLAKSPQPETMAELVEFAGHVAAAKSFTKWTNEDDVLVACMYGMDLGMTASQALTHIYVVNGLPAVYGTVVPGLCIATGSFDLKAHREVIENEGTPNPVAKVTVRRLPDGEPQTASFSWEDAKRAGLTDRSTYKGYAKDMLLARARMRVLKRVWPDVLSGVSIVEEQQDAARTSARYSGEVRREDIPAPEPQPKPKPAPPQKPLLEKPAEPVAKAKSTPRKDGAKATSTKPNGSTEAPFSTAGSKDK